MTAHPLLVPALQIAREAAASLLHGFRTRPESSEKGRNDLVTEFDLASETLLRERLGQLTPDIPILAEEEGGELGPELSWCCDPLDGTMNFVHGHPFFCVSVGLLNAGVPELGIVVAPALALEYAGGAGSPTTRNGEACSVSQISSVKESLLATGFPADRSVAPSNTLATFEYMLNRCHGVRRCGSAALDLCLVSDGTYEAYWERKLAAWDVAGGIALVEAAGGQVSHRNGGPIDISQGHILASDGLVHEEMVQLLEQSLDSDSGSSS